MTHDAVNGWFARSEGQAVYQGTDHQDHEEALARAEVVLSGLSTHAGSARIALTSAAGPDSALLKDASDWRLLRRRLHEHLDRALDALEAPTHETQRD